MRRPSSVRPSSTISLSRMSGGGGWPAQNGTECPPRNYRLCQISRWMRPLPGGYWPTRIQKLRVRSPSRPRQRCCGTFSTPSHFTLCMATKTPTLHFKGLTPEPLASHWCRCCHHGCSSQRAHLATYALLRSLAVNKGLATSAASASLFRPVQHMSI